VYYDTNMSVAMCVKVNFYYRFDILELHHKMVSSHSENSAKLWQKNVSSDKDLQTKLGVICSIYDHLGITRPTNKNMIIP
jgi:hypothetical protein